MPGAGGGGEESAGRKPGGEGQGEGASGRAPLTGRQVLPCNTPLRFQSSQRFHAVGPLIPILQTEQNGVAARGQAVKLSGSWSVCPHVLKVMMQRSEGESAISSRDISEDFLVGEAPL